MNAIKLTILFILFLTGCQELAGGQKERAIIEREEVHTGTEGLAIKFSDNMLTSIRENGIFNILFELENRGAWDIKDGTYTIAVEEQHIELKESQVQKFYLKGRSLISPKGDATLINLKAKTRKITEEKQPASMAITACYTYRTEATADACVDTDLEKRKAQKACEPASQTLGGGQGGPVAVASIEPKMVPSEKEGIIIPYYEIQIQNTGEGFVVEQTKAQDLCTRGRLEQEEFDKIKIQAQLADQTLACEQKKIKEEEKGIYKITCSLPEGISTVRGTYTTFLKIIIDYGYVQIIEKEIEVTK